MLPEEPWLRWCGAAIHPQMVEQRRELPPMVNDRALFTKAAPFNDKEDPFYHSPSNRIGNNYSPQAFLAAAVLFEQFPQDPGAPRTRGRLSDVRATMHASNKPISPRPLLTNGPGSPLRASAEQGLIPSGHSTSPPRGAGHRVAGAKRASPDSPLVDEEGGEEDGPLELYDAGRRRGGNPKAARRVLDRQDPTQLADAILRCATTRWTLRVRGGREAAPRHHGKGSAGAVRCLPSPHLVLPVSPSL